MRIRRLVVRFVVLSALLAPCLVWPRPAGAGPDFVRVGGAGGVDFFYSTGALRNQRTLLWRVVNTNAEGVNITGWNKVITLKGGRRVQVASSLSLGPGETCEGAADDPACQDGPFRKRILRFTFVFVVD